MPARVASHVEIAESPIDRTRYQCSETSLGDAEMDDDVMQHYALLHADLETQTGKDARIRRLSTAFGMECRCIEGQVDISLCLKFCPENRCIECRKVGVLKIQRLSPGQISREIIEFQSLITGTLLA